MTAPEGANTTFDAELAGLRVCDARPERVAEIRAACLAALDRKREQRRPRQPARWRGRWEALAAAGLAVLYLAAAVERTLQVLR